MEKHVLPHRYRPSRRQPRVSTLNRERIKQADSVLRAGGIIAYPTESCYGLGCDPRNNRAIRTLLDIKHRHWNKGLIIVAASVDQLESYIKPIQFNLEKVLQSWPGPTTWILPASEGVSHYLRGVHDGIAVRVTDHPLASLLCRTYRSPIVSTSANPEGKPPALSAKGVRRYFDDKVDLVIEGPLGGLERPTPIYDGVSGKRLRA
ncbi:MAG: L-threonylcarbamoyladenylate synthase [Arenicellales bacterium]